MAEDLLPLFGVNLDGDGENSSDSDDELHDPIIHIGLDNGRIDEDADSDDEDDHDDTMDAEAGGDQPQDQGGGGERSQATVNISYDSTLPGTHSYLGNDLEEVHGRTIHDDESLQTLPLLSLPSVVLVPGQTLPLHLFEPTMVSMIRNVMQGDKTFGLVTLRYVDRVPRGLPVAEEIGTTAEIYSIKEESEERSGISTVRVKAMGRQRFEIKETRRQIDGIVMAKVRILPERVLPRPLEGAVPPSHQKHCRCPSTAVDGGGDITSIFRQWMAQKKRKQIDRFSSANFTWWPPWVYKQYDPYLLMDKVKMELHSWNETLKPDAMPEDPTDFSFWVAGNLPLDDSMKLHLLSIDCAVQRLRCELSIMQRCTVLCCKECGLFIANKKDVFSMSRGGPMGAYVNPQGYVHETLTVYKAKGLHLVGRPSTENSWFPGYAWTILQCRNCMQHMGWKFTAVKKKLQPEKFWGLCRSSLLPGLQNEDEKEDSEGWMPSI